nr:DEAD/DEAH box helicase family protein [Bacteroidota bacterium]
MNSKEARARIKINKLLEDAGWRFFSNDGGKANIVLEGGITITEEYMAAEFGDDFEKTKKGFIDYLLLDNEGFPVALIEAKRESIHPLNAKEQVRKYARSERIQYIILSNGNLHYLWNLEEGNPQVISRFPSPGSFAAFKEFKPDKGKLSNELVENDYIAQTQIPNYNKRPDWVNELTRPNFIEINGLRFLRHYQTAAVKAIQKAVAAGENRFLFEMATGTGKTLTSAAIIKLFLRTGNASRVLFLVDRIELEDQAYKNFKNYLKNDYQTVIFKQSRDEWRKAEIVVTTVQTLQINDKYLHIFDPTDFDLIISDEAHRSIGGNARAVFEYFHGYKLGLTATPKDYLKGVEPAEDEFIHPREMEIRLLKDTYLTFGCEDGNPTFRYSLLDGVKDGYLINPTAVDARTEITTQLLSDKGYDVVTTNEDGNEETQTFIHRDFERKFFSEKTNIAFAQAFIDHALIDPITGEIGKSLLFCVSQNHARKITEILNDFAEKRFPNKYNSDFAVQVTSLVSDAQQMSINFSNNNLNGHSRWLQNYRTSKTRVCVTVGMMTTGYDCQDILNLCLLRPIFSPTDFIQMKGRGTRTFTFEYKSKDGFGKEQAVRKQKETFKLFDFFANCEYFEEKFDYQEKIKVVVPKGTSTGGGTDGSKPKSYTEHVPDPISLFSENFIGPDGMRIDREMYGNNFESRIRSDEYIRTEMEAGNWDQVIHYVKTKIFEKPEENYTLEKLQKAYKIDRKISLREIIEKVFGIIPKFKSKDELLESEFQKFVSIYPPTGNENITALRLFFKAYVVDNRVKEIVQKKKFQEFYSLPSISMEDYKSVPPEYRRLIPEYVDHYVAREKFVA